MSSSFGEHGIRPIELAPSEFLLIKRHDGDESSSIVLHPTPSNDPNDPLNWKTWRKILNYTLVFGVSVAIFTALSIQVNFWQQMVVDLNLTYTQLNNAQAANVAGLSVGCIFFIPLTQKYGRRSAYILSTAVLAGVSWWNYKMNSLAELYLTNLFFGLAGAINESLVQVTVSDLFFVHQRGRINAFYLLAVMLGSFLTPMAASVQAQSQGWRQSYFALSIALSVMAVAFLFLYEETKYIPVIEGAASPEDETAVGDDGHPTFANADGKDTKFAPTAAHRVHSTSTIPMNTYRQRMRLVTPTGESLWELFTFPIRLLVLPHVMYTSIQYAFCIICIVVEATIVSEIFSLPPYNFNVAQLGYITLGPFVGNLLGSFYAGIASDWAVTYFSKKNNGWFRPEYRLYPLILAVFCQSGGLIMFGTTLARGMHWIYPAVGGAIFAFGLGAIGDISFTLLIDTYRPITAEAFVCVSFFRNALCIPFPFLITPWLNGMGLSNMFILLGVVALFVGLLVVPVIIWGKRWRDAMIPYYNRLLERQLVIRSN